MTKRANVDPNDKDSAAPVDRDELQTLFNSFKKEIKEITRVQCENSVSSMSTHVDASMQRLVRAYDVNVQAKLGAVEKELQSLDSRITSSEQSQGLLQGQLQHLTKKYDEMAKSIEMAEATPAQGVPDSSWDRIPDGTILRINAAEPIYKPDMLLAIERLLAEHKGQYVVSGAHDQASRNYTIKFTGLAGVAKTRVQRALASTRRFDGQWEKYEAKVDGDGSNGGAHRDVRVSVSEDKSNKQLARERAGRRMRTILTDMYPDKKFFFNRETGKISSNWIPLAKLEPQQDRTCTISWNNNSPIINLINQADVVTRFRGDNEAVAVLEQWTI